MAPNNQLIQVTASNSIMAATLQGFEFKLEEAARANVSLAGDGFTAAEVRAMTVIEELKLINDMDLAAVLLRGKLLKQIEDEGLWAHHPGQYANMAAMAKDQGISLSELTDTKDLCFIIFPFMEQELGIPVAQAWERIGKSNFRSMISVVKAMITGEASERASTNDAVERILDETAATARAAGQNPTQEQIVAAAVENLLNDGEVMTNRQLQARIRPGRTPAITPTVIRIGGRRVFLADLDEDQYTALQNKLGTFSAPEVYELAAEQGAARRQAARIPMVSRIRQLTEG